MICALFLQVTLPTWLFVVGLIAFAFLAISLAAALFGLTKYRIAHPTTSSLNSEEFMLMLEALADAKISEPTSVEVLTNGDQFYDAALKAIRRARKTINLEAYIFYKGVVTRRFVAALAEKARAGVRVNLVLDGVGNLLTGRAYFRDLVNAGGRFEWYHPLRFLTIPRYNNRTHRELLIIDGEVGFIGGPGFADHWLIAKKNRPRWRDTMVKVTGRAVMHLQATFAENWLEASGELITGSDYFPVCEVSDGRPALVVNSTPSVGGSSRARMLYHVLLAAAQKSIHLSTPYFIPDIGLKEELIRAAQERGVDVKVIVPGRHNDHLLVRAASRAGYGSLLRAGVRIFEYQPAMMHVKALMVDGIWSVVGSTNFDNRSFGLNDEANLAVYDPGCTNRLEEDFSRDLSNSYEITFDDWTRRPVLERVPEMVGWVLERQA